MLISTFNFIIGGIFKMDEIILRNENGQILASSREVADRFGKNHKDVLESVRNLTAENSAVKDMFQISQYTNSRGRNYDQYLMNRDGFSLLAMGFTGKKALEWKLKYINAFNMMEEKLNHPYKLPSTYKEALIQLVEKVEENERLLEDNEHKQEIINGFTDDIDIYKKKDIINRICRHRHENYANRYTELYR
jgi:anti-repressor protein